MNAKRRTSKLLKLFDTIIDRGKHCTMMAHFSHPRELSTNVVREAISRVRATGATIRTQSPIVKHVNDSASIWKAFWEQQICLGLIPYYMFLESADTLTDYFKVTLCEALEIFQEAQRQSSGLTGTIRGTVTNNGYRKLLIDGITKTSGQKKFVIKCLQAPTPSEKGRIYLMDYSSTATAIENIP